MHVDPLLGATLKRSFSLPDLDQPATFSLRQGCNPLLVSFACERPALSPARHTLYEDVQEIRNPQLRTVKSVSMSDTSQTARNLAFDAQTIQIRSGGSGTCHQLGQALSDIPRWAAHSDLDLVRKDLVRRCVRFLEASAACTCMLPCAARLAVENPLKPAQARM